MMDIMATEKTALIKTSAGVVGLVIVTQFAETPTALTLVGAISVSMVMGSCVAMWMSAPRVSTIVTPKLYVLIRWDHIVVPV